jgi:hypothetical protein
MTDTTNTAAETKPKKKPSHVAYHVRDGQGDKNYWDRVGVAWAHDDGKGFNVTLHAVPIDGRITLRVPEEK